MARISKPDLAVVIETFPELAQIARRLYMSSASFRDLCADFALARLTLVGFERRPDAAERPEIPEYRGIIEDLAGDIAECLRQVERQTSGGAAQ